MDLTDVENTCKKIVELRTKRLALQEEINKNVADVLAYMNSMGKRTLKVGKFSVEIATRVRRNFDFDYLDRLQADGLIPITAMSKSEYQRLMVMSGANMRIENGRFVYD